MISDDDLAGLSLLLYGLDFMSFLFRSIRLIVVVANES